MAINVKGGAPQAKAQTPTTTGNAIAEAYARLEQKKAKKGKGAKAAGDAVADAIDDAVRDDSDLEAELEMARQILDEVAADLPEGSGLEQAEAIAEQLKEKLEATRGQRAPRAQKVQRAFESLDD